MSVNSKNIISDLNQKAWEHRYIDRDMAMTFAVEAKQKSERTGELINLNFSELTIAQLLFWKTSDGEYLKTAKKVLSFFENENQNLGISRAHAICAGIYDQFGQYEKAMQHALLALKSAEELDDKTNKSDCYTLLGQVYSRIHDYNNAIKYFIKGLDIRKKLKDNKAVASSLNLVARSYVLSKKFDEAKKYYEESLALRSSIDDADGIPWTYLGLASLYNDKGDFKTALDFYIKAEASNKNKEKRFDLLCLIGKGKIELNQFDANTAVEILSKALIISEDLKITSLKSEIHQLLALAFENKKDYNNSLKHYKQYDLLRQEILSNEKINQLKQQQIAFSIEASEKEAEIHRLKNVELKNAFDKIAFQKSELEQKNKEITDSINYAKRIQDAYLPKKDVFCLLLKNSFLLYQPKDIVSGDFYWYSKVNSNEFSVLYAVADCTGHGVPGAIMSVICCNALNEVVVKKNIIQPDLILNEVRNIITNAFEPLGETTQKDGMDISLVRLIYEKGIVKLQFAGANNPLWIIRNGKPLNSSVNITESSNSHMIEVKADKQPVGIYDKMNSFSLYEMDLQKGDLLYSFTDGFVDQFGGPFGKKFKSKSLKELLFSIHSKPMNEQELILLKTFNDWKNNHEQVDDMCMIGVRV